MTELVLVRKGSEYTVEAPLSASAATGISETEQKDKIDDIIADLQAVTIQRSDPRNGLALVSRLPDDLLVEIWKYLAYGYPKPKGWLGVTHVCSRWRQVALDSPTLWQEPLFGTEEMTEEMIGRSRDTALSFDISFRNHTRLAREYRLRTIHEQMHRVKSLSLDLGSMELGTFEVKSAPVLTKLSISSCPGNSTFINFFFRGSCPNLTHISLRECDFFKYAERIQLLASVIDLSVSTTDGDARAPPQQVIASLQKFPNLRRLVLRNVFEHFEAATEVDSQHDLGKVHFPKLEMFYVSTALVNCLRFLDLIHYPTSANVSIKMYGWQGSEVRSILNSLIGRFDSAPQRLVVDFDGDLCYRLLLESPEDAPELRRGHLTLHSDFTSSLRGSARNFPPLIASLPILHDLHSLTFSAPYATKEFWRCCGNLPRLETLRVECDQLDFLQVLAQASPDSNNDGPIRRPYFPSLRTLILKDIPDRNGIYAHYFEDPDRGGFVEECRRVAKVRKEKFHEMFEYKVLVI